MAPDGSRLLTLAAASVQTAPDGSRPIVWMIKWMIKAHPTENRMPGRATPVVGHQTPPQASARLGLLWRVAGVALGLLGVAVRRRGVGRLADSRNELTDCSTVTRRPRHR